MCGLLKNISCADCIHGNKSIFAGIDQETADHIHQLKVMNHFQKGQSVYLQDNPAFGVFCLHSGKLKITKADKQGNDSIVRLVNPGELIGHSSLLADEPYYASAVTLEDSSVCFFDKKSVIEILSKSNLIALNVIKALSGSLRTAELHTASKSQQNVREKLANLFLSLMKTNGVKAQDTCMLDIKLTREELGAIIGSTTETVCRLITEFKNEGLITESGKIIYIINEEKLKKFANN